MEIQGEILYSCPLDKQCVTCRQLFVPLSDIMDLRHQSSAMCIIMLGEEDTHPWSATKVGNPTPATILVAKRNNQQTTQTSHYRSQPVENFLIKTAMIWRFF